MNRLRQLLCVLLAIPVAVTVAADLKPDSGELANEARLQSEFALKAYYEDFDLLERIAYPLFRVGSPYCSDKRLWAIGAAPRSVHQMSEE